MLHEPRTVYEDYVIKGISMLCAFIGVIFSWIITILAGAFLWPFALLGWLGAKRKLTEKMEIELTVSLAHAVIDMDNHAYRRDFEFITEEAVDAWKSLLKIAEDFAGRKSDETRRRE